VFLEGTKPVAGSPCTPCRTFQESVSVDPYAASRSVQSVCFHRCYLVNLAVVQPDFLSVGYRIGNRFDEVVQIRFFAMPDW